MVLEQCLHAVRGITALYDHVVVDCRLVVSQVSFNLVIYTVLRVPSHWHAGGRARCGVRKQRTELMQMVDLVDKLRINCLS